MNNIIENLDINKEDFVIVTDEDGNEHRCVILDIIEYKNKNYASLVPAEALGDPEVDDDIDTADLFIMEIEENDKGNFLKSIEDKENYEEICTMMINRLSEDFEIEY